MSTGSPPRTLKPSSGPRISTGSSTVMPPGETARINSDTSSTSAGGVWAVISNQSATAGSLAGNGVSQAFEEALALARQDRRAHGVGELEEEGALVVGQFLGDDGGDAHNHVAAAS